MLETSSPASVVEEVVEPVIEPVVEVPPVIETPEPEVVEKEKEPELEAIDETVEEAKVEEPVVKRKKQVLTPEQIAIREQEAKRHAKLIAFQQEDLRKKEDLIRRRAEEEKRRKEEAEAAAKEKAKNLSEGTLHKPAVKDGAKPSANKDAKKGKGSNKDWNDEENRKRGLKTRGAAPVSNGWRSPKGKNKGRGTREEEVEHAFTAPTEPVVHEVLVPETISVSDLAKKMAIKANELIKTLMGMGMMVTINQVLDQETAIILVEEMGHTAIAAADNDPETFLVEAEHEDAVFESRPPVVTVMGLSLIHI